MPLPPPCMTAHEVLASHTTIGLGGPARWFARCTSAEEIRASLRFAREEHLPVQVLAGGSNIIFADGGFEGVVLQVTLPGYREEETPSGVLLTVGAGEVWDSVVERSVKKGWSGIECLSGIPGSTGGTPVQNVGAYGQEVAETLVSLRAIDRGTLQDVEFSHEECGLAYRQSRFKTKDADRYIITEVRFRLKKNVPPEIRYAELAQALAPETGARRGEVRPLSPAAVREAVIGLRRKKSMVMDPADENTRSVGSFFTNPVVPPAFYDEHLRGLTVPAYPAPAGVKLSAAWLVEHAGFPRGFRKGGAGISDRHALAIVNRGGTTADVIALAAEIEHQVMEKFGIGLEREPVIVQTGAR